MAFIDVAARGSASEPFQLAGKNPILHTPGLRDDHDRLWRDAYDDGAHPAEEADAALEDDE